MNPEDQANKNVQKAMDSAMEAMNKAIKVAADGTASVPEADIQKANEAMIAAMKAAQNAGTTDSK